MDVLSSQATVAGYRAVLLAATRLPKLFPMMTTAAGTITPAKVLVIGPAWPVCRRSPRPALGRASSRLRRTPGVKEQVQSLGAKFVELELPPATRKRNGGYAKAMDEEFYRRQREMMDRSSPKTTW